MRKKEIIIFSTLNLLCIFLLGVVLGAKGAMDWLLRGIFLLGDDSKNIEKLWIKLLEVWRQELLASVIIVVLMMVIFVVNYFGYYKKYRELLKSLEK